MNPETDTWTWRALLDGGAWLSEDELKTIGNLPASLVKEFHLRHRSEQGNVVIDLSTGQARINGGAPILPAVDGVAELPKVPMFFRRKAMTNALSANPEVTTHFRAIGYAVFSGGKPVHMAALRVFDAAIDSFWYTTWPDSTCAHVANTGMLIGG